MPREPPGSRAGRHRSDRRIGPKPSRGTAVEYSTEQDVPPPPPDTKIPQDPDDKRTGVQGNGGAEQRVRSESDPERVQILVSEREHETVDGVLRALGSVPDLFQRASRLVD